jgi:hypothetical protein
VRETVVEATDSSVEGQKRAAVMTALDCVVGQFSSSHAANPGADHDPAKVKSRRRSESRNEGVPAVDLESSCGSLSKV